MSVCVFWCSFPGSGELPTSIALVVMRPCVTAFAFEDYPYCLHLVTPLGYALLFNYF